MRHSTITSKNSTRWPPKSFCKYKGRSQKKQRVGNGTGGEGLAFQRLQIVFDRYRLSVFMMETHLVMRGFFFKSFLIIFHAVYVSDALVVVVKALTSISSSSSSNFLGWPGRYLSATLTTFEASKRLSAWQKFRYTFTSTRWASTALLFQLNRISR